MFNSIFGGDTSLYQIEKVLKAEEIVLLLDFMMNCINQTQLIKMELISKNAMKVGHLII